MTFSIELQPHEVDTIMTALIALGGHYNDKAKVSGVTANQLYRAKADDVFKMVCKLPRVDSPECCSDIAAHEIEVSKAAWGENWFC